MRPHPLATALSTLGLAALGLTALPADLGAIPAFARKYNVSCALCHAPVPRLTPFGEVFAGNGFEMAPGEVPRDTLFTGDSLLRLQRALPLGVRVDLYQRALSRRAAGEASIDQQSPWVVKLLSGGQVADRISYYFYFMLSERGEVAGLEDAYLQFTDVGGSGVNLVVGQFQVSDPLFKRELRLTYEDYQPYRARVGQARADLAYERGVMALWSPREGTDLTVQVVNGQGLDEATAARQYDRDSHQSYVARLSQDVGPIRLGVFGYSGRESGNGVDDRIHIFGPDATIPLGERMELNLQALRRWDSDPFFGTCSVGTPCPGGATAPFASRVDAGMAELVVSPQGPLGRWFVTALYNDIRADDPIVSLRLGEQASATGFLERYRTGSLGFHFAHRRNVRMMAEGIWDWERERLALVTGVIVGF